MISVDEVDLSMLDEKECSRFVVRLSSDEMNKLSWREGQDLEMEIQEKKLVIKPK